MAITAAQSAPGAASTPRPAAGPLRDAWDATSQTIHLGSGEIHYVDFGGGKADTGGTGTADELPIILVHGLGGSYANWGPLAPKLADQRRVYALDLIGFGLSHPAGRRATVTANATMLADFIDTVAGGRAVLVGNSMGGLISMLVATARPEKVAALVLLDPVVPRDRRGPHDLEVAATFAAFAIPGIGAPLLRARRLRTPAREAVLETLRLCSPHPERVPEPEVAVAARIIEARRDEPGLERAYLQAARSLLWVMARSRHAYAMMHALPMPVMLLAGEADRLVPVGSLRAVAKRNPHWRFETFPDVGHVPMLEIPDTVAERIASFLPAAP